MAVIIIGEDALEELRKELNRPRPGAPERGKRRRPGRDKEEVGTLLCEDMTCPCRLVARK